MAVKSYPGTFITFEGMDGSGKTTQARNAYEYLTDLGYDTILTREPGGTEVGEKIRQIALSTPGLSPVSQLLLFSAARQEHINTVIRPALMAGKIVICDRFIDSTYAYQGYGGGCVPEVLQLEAMVCKDMLPTFTLFMDIDIETSNKRIAARLKQATPTHKDVFDDETIGFKSSLYIAYKERLIKFPERIVRIDASAELNKVTSDVNRWIISNIVLENK